MDYLEIARKMLLDGTDERKAAEKVMGINVNDMTQVERNVAAECLAAFPGIWRIEHETILAKRKVS